MDQVLPARPARKRARDPRALAAAIVALIAFAVPATGDPARAQPAINLPRDFFEDRRRTDGDSLRFCYAADLMTAPFDRAVAEELAAALLLEPVLVPIETLLPVEPLDYRLPLGEEDLFVAMADRCDAFMGFTLADSGYPEWMRITRPYFVSRTVLVTRSPDIHRLEDVPLDRRVGTRILSGSDNRLLLYLQSLPETLRWRRTPYRNNQVLLDRLRDGQIAVALIWEPALLVGTGGDPGAEGIRIIDGLPFGLRPTEIGILLRSGDSYLDMALGEAIRLLRADGTIDHLLRQHGLQDAE